MLVHAPIGLFSSAINLHARSDLKWVLVDLAKFGPARARNDNTVLGPMIPGPCGHNSPIRDIFLKKINKLLEIIKG